MKTTSKTKPVFVVNLTNAIDGRDIYVAFANAKVDAKEPITRTELDAVISKDVYTNQFITELMAEAREFAHEVNETIKLFQHQEEEKPKTFFQKIRDFFTCK